MTTNLNNFYAYIRLAKTYWFLTAFIFPISISLILIKYFNNLKYKILLKQFEGKVVLITGASSGLGEALAHCFYNAGCKVILSARRENELIRVRDILVNTYKVFIYDFKNKFFFFVKLYVIL